MKTQVHNQMFSDLKREQLGLNVWYMTTDSHGIVRYHLHEDGSVTLISIERGPLARNGAMMLPSPTTVAEAHSKLYSKMKSEA